MFRRGETASVRRTAHTTAAQKPLHGSCVARKSTNKDPLDQEMVHAPHTNGPLSAKLIHTQYGHVAHILQGQALPKRFHSVRD